MNGLLYTNSDDGVIVVEDRCTYTVDSVVGIVIRQHSSEYLTSRWSFLHVFRQHVAIRVSVKVKVVNSPACIARYVLIVCLQVFYVCHVLKVTM